MIDTHAHLDSEQFNEDRNILISDLLNNGVNSVIIPAINPDNFDKVLELANANDNIYCGIGVHPHDADSYNEEVKSRIFNLCNNKKVKAIGEIGLDYYYNFSTPEQQKKVFADQLAIAKELDLPAIIHNRDSDEDLLNIIKDNQDGKLRGVLHCFSGDYDFMMKALDLGLNVSFTGNITFKKFDRQDVVAKVPNDRFFLETDSPFMTPVPHRDKRNEPKYLNLVASKIAEIKEIEIKEVIDMTTKNAKKFFDLFLVLAIMLTGVNLYSQNFDGDEEYAEILEEIPHPYPKPLGIGFVLATNTIVESYTPKPSNVSYEGLLSLGGTIQYSLLDYIILSASYGYSKNSKLAEKYPEIADKIKPNVHQQIELTSNFIINPYSRINFFGMIGFTYLMNEYGNPNELGASLNSNSPGINTGLGFYINIPIKSAGLFNVVAEWKLNFMLNDTKLSYDPRIAQGKEGWDQPVEVNTFFSMPRLSIIWFPENIF